jgi:hypothetical protein
MAGKKGPNENSWTMCERFITVVRTIKQRPTRMIRVLVAHVSVSEGGNVQVCSDLLHLYAAIHPTSRTVVDLVVRRTVLCMLPLDPWFGGEKPAKSRDGPSLTRGMTLGR